MSGHSKLPPPAVRMLRNLPESERKLRAAELLASYEGRMLKLEAVGQRMAQDWVINQAEFFAGICDELREIILTGDAP